MKIYLAAPYSRKDEINKYAAELRAGGVIVTSSWLEEPHKPDTQMQDLPHDINQGYAVQDVKDVAAADILILWTDPTKSIIRQGRTAELGIWIGLNHARHRHAPVFVVGLEDENIFHHCPEVSHFESWELVRDLVLDLTGPRVPQSHP
jgi:nucleoside 2-deoxyribosyltransferase